ncbi:sulfatase [Sphingomonas canadensis]|uniref:Sulfatase n=1 Tax=Sphingomonas canadensis TaxID=1219257 RepID=A0ABW3H5A4_9SPHN|nr:sulfatase-like hydrolase/transferase [Sphingomonas canadensis]MCW3836194.1 sulfatase-like hydrolase/transferase [Sphingomonas canadensis]
MGDLMRKHDRRHILKGGAAALGAAAASRSIAAPRSPRKPNIVFIMADDLGYADLSCYGRRDYETPNIDRLAVQGVRFTQGYANSSVCSATRLALITGRYQYRLPLGLEEPLAERDIGLPPEHPTLPSQLRLAGYTTMLIGKWHLGRLPKYGPRESGYDHFFGFRGGALDYFTHESNGRGDLWDGDHKVEMAGYMTDLLGDRAVKAVGELAHAGKPFLISLHFSAPHWPWEGPEDRAEAERLAAKAGPDAAFSFDGGSLATYARMVERMDHQVGRVMAALDRAGIAEDTIVVFTSDNGGERFSDTWPFTGKKTELLEGGIRIPAILRWPRRIPRATTSDQVMISMDWMPTLLASAGAAIAPDCPSDGIDILPAVLSGAPVPRTLFWRYLHMRQQACRSGSWKYLKIGENQFLFDVIADPLERANLKDRRPEIFAGLVAQYQAWEATMLPLDPASYSHHFSGRDMADHFGVPPGDD